MGGQNNTQINTEQFIDKHIVNNIFHNNEGESLKIEDIPERLKDGAKAYYKRITARQGRFGHLKIEVEGEEEQDKKERLGLIKQLIAHVRSINLPEAQPLPQQLIVSTDNILLLGDSGIGKTFSLLWIWKTYLEKQDWDCIPIFIPLDRYNRVPRAVKEQFITHYIATEYLGYRNLDDQIANTLWKWLNGDTDKSQQNEAEKRLPVLLLLDGLDEITTDINPLLIDLDEHWVKLTNTKEKEGHEDDKIIVSSRFKSNHRFAEGFESLYIQKLTPKRIQESLKSPSHFEVINDDLKALLSTPMMLTLYLSIVEEEQGSTVHLNNITDLISIYLSKQFDNFEGQQEKEGTQLEVMCRFLLHYMLPFIAYQMEVGKVQEITEVELEKLVNAAFKRFQEPDFFRKFDFRKDIKLFRKHLNDLEIRRLTHY